MAFALFVPILIAGCANQSEHEPGTVRENQRYALRSRVDFEEQYFLMKLAMIARREREGPTFYDAVELLGQLPSNDRDSIVLESALKPIILKESPSLLAYALRGTTSQPGLDALEELLAQDKKPYDPGLIFAVGMAIRKYEGERYNAIREKLQQRWQASSRRNEPLPGALRPPSYKRSSN